MDELELDALNKELTEVSSRMAEGRRWEDVSGSARRRLWRPYGRLGLTLAVVGAIAVVGVLEGNWGLVALAAVNGLAFLPDQVEAAKQRARAIDGSGGDLFAEYAAECRERRLWQLAQLVMSLPLALGLLIFWVAVAGAWWALVGAAIVALSIPYQVLVRLPQTSREVREANRWEGRREEESDDDEEEDDEDDEDDDATWTSLLLHALSVAILYVGPLIALYLVFALFKETDRMRNGIALGVLVAAWLYVAFFETHEDEA